MIKWLGEWGRTCRNKKISLCAKKSIFVCKKEDLCVQIRFLCRLHRRWTMLWYSDNERFKESRVVSLSLEPTCHNCFSIMSFILQSKSSCACNNFNHEAFNSVEYSLCQELNATCKLTPKHLKTIKWIFAILGKLRRCYNLLVHLRR
jgi:hypothetical protein